MSQETPVDKKNFPSLQELASEINGFTRRFARADRSSTNHEPRPESEENPEKTQVLSNIEEAVQDQVSSSMIESARYIVCPPFQPFRLGKCDFVIGRDISCRVVLTSQEVSRIHAILRYQENCYVLEDQDSANGTLVNDHLVQSHVLRNNDKIKIGSYVMTYCEVPIGAIPGNSSEAEGKDSTLQMSIHASMLRKVNRKKIQELEQNLQGDIETYGIATILQVLTTQNKTGCLKMMNHRDIAFIYFLEGIVVHSSCSELRGREAFFGIALWEDGQFSFNALEPPHEVSMSDTVEWLLLETAHRKDQQEAIDEY